MRYILILVVILNTSFIEIPKRYWVASCTLKGNSSETYIARVIESTDHKTAKKLFDAEINECIKYWIRKISDRNIHLYEGSYLIFELKKDDIIR